MLVKGFGIPKSKTMKSRIDQEIIRRRFLCNTEGHKSVTKDKRGKTCYPHVTRYDRPARIEIVLNELSE